MTQSLKTNQLICFPIEKPSATAKLDMDVSKNRGTQNGWFIMENPIKIDDLGVPLFLETPNWCFCSFSFQLDVTDVIIGPPSNDLQRETARRMARDLPRSGVSKLVGGFNPVEKY